MTSVAASGPADLLGRHRAVVAALAVSIFVVALVWVASVPTGSDSSAGTVRAGSRLAARAPVGDVEVFVVAQAGALSVHVAYPSPKGWLSVRLPSAPSTAVAAWAATEGTGPVPTLSAVYGRSRGDTVDIRWADGEHTTVRPAADGVYLAVRGDRVASDHVRILDADGTTLLEVDGP